MNFRVSIYVAPSIVLIVGALSSRLSTLIKGKQVGKTISAQILKKKYVYGITFSNHHALVELRF